MSNRHVRELSEVYRCIFQDARSAYPTLGIGLEKSLSRLLRIVARDGIQVFLVYLPAVGKNLDRSLACGQLRLPGLPLLGGASSTIQMPKFLRELYQLVFHNSGLLREDCDIQAVFFLRQILGAAKKATMSCTVDRIADEVCEFVDTDSQLPAPESFWSADASSSGSSIKEVFLGFRRSSVYAPRVDAMDTRERGQLSIFLAQLDIVSSFVTATLGPFDPTMWRFRHGPGAVAETTGPSNKYCWKNWSNSLEHEFPIADYGFHSHSSWADRVHRSDSIGSREPVSRMVAVPKSFSKPRLIAAEPSEQMWAQQAVWHYFAQRSSNSWINRFVRFRDQSLNQELCTVGASVGTLATVDLSAASDRVTCHLVGNLFRANPKVVYALRASRTPCVEQKLTPRAPELIELRKFSTMGNACTFPVESLAFLSIALAAVLTVRNMRATPRNILRLVGEVAVYGDDLVIPVDSRELLQQGLEVLHFKVNTDKSYWTGRFRESCGVESFRGVNVTPAYWKTYCDDKPESVASTIQCSNHFYQKWLLNTASYLASTLPRGIPPVIMGSGVGGLQTRLRPVYDGFPIRYNTDLQRVEIFYLTLRASQKKIAVHDDTALLQFFTEDPDPCESWSSGIALRPKHHTVPGWESLADLATQRD